jgi:hypothetical protein
MRTLFHRGLALAAAALWPALAAGAPQVQVSPGPLTRAHAKLEGVTNCAQCHDPARALPATKCLACHKPIAERIASHRGVHRDVADDCTKCHKEHRGVDADLRRLDQGTFNHAVEAGYPLEGRHAALATRCAACHKKRSYIAARPTCGSCHADAHKTTLGDECARCHSFTVPFKQAREHFDHARAQFKLTGAHQRVACEKCHVNAVFHGLRFDTCSGCHKAPHRRTLGPSCTSCHTTERWAVREFDHARAAFALVGAHTRVTCVKCHTAGVAKALEFDRCSACHVNIHRESIKQDCRACHNEADFRGATFDHAVKTGFALVGRHDHLACRKCHTTLSPDTVPVASKVLDFKGASAECITCHKDQHKGEFGRACDACHRPLTFKVEGFAHPRSPEFFAGRHQGIACVKCHVRAPDARTPRVELAAAPAPDRAKPPSMTCSGCHADVHLGQLGAACDRCHAVDAVRFAPSRFSHDSGRFKLTGKHQAVACVKCHPSEAGAFPAGPGTAKRFNPVSNECGTCHKDPHLGQVETRCATCHATATFKISAYEHKGLDFVFSVATHSRLPCKSCHKTETGQFPAGSGTTIRFKVPRTCVGCHP